MRQIGIRLLSLLLLGVCLFSGWKICTILMDYRESEAKYESISNSYVQIVPPTDESGTESSPEAIFPEEPHSSPEEAAPITVDFDALLTDCPDVVGWLYCPDTPIDYPVVQSEDNSYYLRRLLDGTWDISGSIFMDYRCADDFSDGNTILYGHNMKNGAMFGTLQRYKDQTYYNAHPVLYLLTPAQNYKMELIGGYTTHSTDTETYSIPLTQAERDELVAQTQMQTTFQAETAIREGERFVTLSTCAYEYDNARYVLVGVLREISALSES